MVVLSEALVKSKTKLEILEEVRNLNVCGQGIDEVSILKQTPSVEVLSLSVNRLTSLRHLAFCSQLKQLYLRANAITDLTEIRYLMSLQQLTTLWLADNPCTKLPHYRAVVVANLPKLENLDNVAINEADRRAAKGVRLLQPVTAADVLAEELEAAEQALLEEAQQYAGLQDTQLHSPQQLPSPRHSPRQPHAPTCSPRSNTAAATPPAAAVHQKSPVAKAVSLSGHSPHRNTDHPRGSDTSSSIPTAEGAAAHSRAGPPARAMSSTITNQVSPRQAGGAHSALPSAAGTYRRSVDRDLCAEPSQQSRSHSVTPRDLGNPSSTGLNVVTGLGEAADVTGQQLYGEHSCIPGLRQQAHQPHLQQHEEQRKMWLAGGAEHTPGGLSCNQQKQQQHLQWRAAEHAASSCSSGSPVSRTNVLYAVMALLGELDASGLGIVQREVQLRLLEQ